MSTRLYQRVEGGDTNVTFTSLARLVEGFEVDVVDLLAATRNVASPPRRLRRRVRRRR
jgi:hypothetical protein